MPDGKRARQRVHHVLAGEVVADIAEAAGGVEPGLRVVGDDAAGLLSAMLQRVQAEGDEIGRVLGADHAEDAAFLVQLVIVSAAYGIEIEWMGGGELSVLGNVCHGRAAPNPVSMCGPCIKSGADCHPTITFGTCPRLPDRALVFRTCAYDPGNGARQVIGGLPHIEVTGIDERDQAARVGKAQGLEEGIGHGAGVHQHSGLGPQHLFAVKTKGAVLAGITVGAPNSAQTFKGAKRKADMVAVGVEMQRCLNADQRIGGENEVRTVVQGARRDEESGIERLRASDPGDGCEASVQRRDLVARGQRGDRGPAFGCLQHGVEGEVQPSRL